MKNSNSSFGVLGSDFWIFRFGQFISIIGDACTNVAFAWWILDKTDSPAKMAAVFAPVTFVRIFLLPLFGPLGDRYSRKWLVIFSDAWRGVFFLIIAMFAYFNFFQLSVLVPVFMLATLGTAIYTTASSSILPNLVGKSEIHKALQATNTISAVGSILGGAAGGVIFSALGPGGAFMFNTVTFFIAAMASYCIKANTRPVRDAAAVSGLSLASWIYELKAGFYAIIKMPIQIWICIIGALLNFVMSPMSLALPILVKETRNLPPWFLGLLNSSMSCGTIVGAIAVGWLCKQVFPDKLIAGGLVFTGVGLILLPLAVIPILPVCIMFLLGASLMFVNVPLGAQMTLATPDEYRARIGSVTAFLYQIMVPLGISISGIIISNWGLAFTLLAAGAAVSLIGPLMLTIPGFSMFYRLSPEKAENCFKWMYPDAFMKKTTQAAQI